MATEAINAAKLRVTAAERGHSSASNMLKSAKSQMTLVEQMMASAKLQMKSAESQVTSSKKELDDAQEYLKSVEMKMEVIDVDLSDSEDNDKGKGSADKKKKKRKRQGENNENNAVVDLSRSTSTNATFGITRSGVQNATRDLDRSMQIFVKPENKTLTLDVKLADTILSVKTKIFEKGCVKPELQRLMYGGKYLEDEKTLSFYNIQNHSTLQYLCPRPNQIEIYVKTLTGSPVSLDVDLSSKVSSLKHQYYMKQGVPTDTQRLIYGGSILEDDTTLSECKIQDQSSIMLVIRSQNKIPIVIEMIDGKSIKMNVTPSDKVSELKDEIYVEESIPQSQQCLIFKGETLDDNKTLSHYSIQRESKLHLVREFVRRSRP